MVDIRNTDDVIDSRDVIERLEELEDLRKPWAAGWHMPGYLPDNEPAAFETWEAARDYITAELQRSVDEAFGDRESAAGSDATWIVSVNDAMERLDGAQEAQAYGETVGSFHYWIERSECEFEDPSDAEEYEALKDLADEASQYAEDWDYGVTLIRYSYFTAYCQELCDDIGALPKNTPDYIVIDWEATARNLRVDYTEVSFGGVAYLIR